MTTEAQPHAAMAACRDLNMEVHDRLSLAKPLPEPSGKCVLLQPMLLSVHKGELSGKGKGLGKGNKQSEAVWVQLLTQAPEDSCPCLKGPWRVPGLSLQCSGRRSRPCSSSTGMIRSRSGTSLGRG